eukprot:scaffold158490_cov35-Attheya_sp.AAC.1
MFLTLQQAERNLKDFLGSKDDAEENSLEDVMMGAAQATATWEELGITDKTLLRNLEKMGCASPL